MKSTCCGAGSAATEETESLLLCGLLLRQLVEEAQRKLGMCNNNETKNKALSSNFMLNYRFDYPITRVNLSPTPVYRWIDREG